MSSAPFIALTNVVILGKQGVGKTTIFKLLQGCLESKYSVVTKRRCRQVEVNNDHVHVIVSDINLPTIQNQDCPYSVCNANSIILVYSEDDLDSFEYVESMKNFFPPSKREWIPIDCDWEQNWSREQGHAIWGRRLPGHHWLVLALYWIIGVGRKHCS